MKQNDGMIECHVAWRLLDMMRQTWEFYFPPELRERYIRIAARYEMQGQTEWLATLKAKLPQITEAFAELGKWSASPDSAPLMSKWDDDTLFFYVMRIQFLVCRLAAKPDDMIPGTCDGFWTWGMSVKPDDPWMLFPVLTRDALKSAKTKPPLWQIAYPADYPEVP